MKPRQAKSKTIRRVSTALFPCRETCFSNLHRIFIVIFRNPGKKLNNSQNLLLNIDINISMQSKLDGKKLFPLELAPFILPPQSQENYTLETCARLFSVIPRRFCQCQIPHNALKKFVTEECSTFSPGSGIGARRNF